MKNNYFSVLKRIPSQLLISLLLCAVFFLCGCILGSFAAGQATELEAVHTYLRLPFSTGEGDQIISFSFWDFLLQNLQVPFLAFLLGMSLFGFVLLPILAVMIPLMFLTGKDEEERRRK